LSVAEILAAARKADSKSDAPPPAASEPAPAEPEAVAEASEPAAPPAKSAAPKPAAPKAAAGGARPSVAEMLAAARAQKGPAQPAAAAPAKPAAAKPAAAEKAAPKPKPAEKPAAKPEPITTAEKDTASILAAASKTSKPGPMSKAEAAKLNPDAPPKPPKEPKARIVVPPMPVKPDYAKPKAKQPAADEDRRVFVGMLFGSFLAVGFTTMATTFGLWTLGMARFMFPNILTEPPSKFKVGFPNDFPPGSVEEKFKALFGVWVVNTEYNGKREIVALRTVCTHLGCTPNWLEGEQKFKCPCHGSGFYKDGINFEGPAPRPLERYAIALADDGQLEVDKSKLFQEELGQWNDPSSFVAV
jgi:cytochrome b6-f complex iron-sulfur subunit